MRLCCFCGNTADDQPGAPLCVQCWARMDQQARDEKLDLVAMMRHPTPLPNLAEYIEAQRASGRRDALFAWFADLPPPPSDAARH
jgi:hypothetical protein